MNLSEFVNDVLLWCVTLGAYAEKVQDHAPSYLSKTGSHVFSRSLTSSDLAIERFIEVALLGKYPGVVFLGEESERSLNKEFFPTEGEYVVSLDPINHTSYYQAGESQYEIIVTLSYRGRVQCAICYQPAFKRAFIALEGKAYVASAMDIQAEKWDANEFQVPQSASEEVLTINDGSLTNSLAAVCCPLDAIETYLQSNRTVGMSDILSGNIIGFAKRHAHLRDWIAVAYIVYCAGGSATNFSGVDFSWQYNHEHCAEELLVTNHKAFHSKLLEVLSN
ncbi:MAG: hypothetical protein KDD62_11005 [Bdellovibrionales bacterium]|nr:hypothetical protein [Bdellovibrionales bacterium]